MVGSILEDFISSESSEYERIFLVISNEGTIYQGKVKGYDQACNLVLSNCDELFPGGLKKKRGLLVLRGDNVSLIGELEKSASLKRKFESGDVSPKPHSFIGPQQPI